MFPALVVAVAACSAGPSTSMGSAAVPSSDGSSGSAESGPLKPEGTILFLRTSGDDDHGFFVANADGSNERQLTDPSLVCCLARRSPDGMHILTMPAGEPPQPVTGGTLDLATSEFTPFTLTDATLNLVPGAWSPDGSRVAFEGWDDSDPGRTGVYTATAGEITDLLRLTDAEGAPHDIPLDISPDGSQLVFYRSVRAEPDFPIDIGGSLWVVDTDGSNAHRLDTPPPNWWARWSPDGSSILFASERNLEHGTIWTIAADGSALTSVLEDPDGGFPIDPTWSPDGDMIMFMLDPVADRFTHPSNAIYVVRTDGTGLTRLIDTADFKSAPEWWSGS